MVKKDKDRGVHTLNEGKSLATEWFDQMCADAPEESAARARAGKGAGEDSSEDEGDVRLQIRQPRLGLGAKFIPHSQALLSKDFRGEKGKADGKLSGTLKALKRKQGDRSVEEREFFVKPKAGRRGEDEDEGESRTAAISKKQKKQQAAQPAEGKVGKAGIGYADTAALSVASTARPCLLALGWRWCILGTATARASLAP